MTNKINIDRLLQWARNRKMTPKEREAQRRSFAFGNVNIHNPEITREFVEKIADELEGKK